jgi:hypothetical protein
MELSLSLTHTARLRFMLLVMFSSIVTLFFDRVVFPGWISAAVWGFGYALFYGLYAWSTGDKLIQRLFIFGLAAGFAELMADAWLVHFTRTLIYPEGGPMLASSPAYMPFSWLVVIIQLGFIAHLLLLKFSVVRTGFLLMLLAGLMIPLYEYWAIKAGWWHYRHTAMIWGVPYFIFGAEAILAFSIPFFVKRVAEGKLYFNVIFGILQGIIMWLACIAAYYLFA